MGNTSLKTLQEFISTLNERNIIKVSEEEIVAKTNAVHYLLKENKECLNELKQIGTNQYVGTNESGENENNQTNSNNITFYTNFCKIISKLISYSFDNANIIIYSRIIDIMIILSNEKVFIDYFMENSIDSMNLMMFKGDFKYSISFTVRGIVLFQNIISFFYMHPSYVAKNIIQINKILLTPKLLCDSNYFSKKEIRIQLAILLRNCLNFFILLKKKNGEFKNEKEIRKTVRPALNQYYQNSVFQILAASITKKEMNNCNPLNTKESYRFIVANIFVLLCQIRSVIKDQLIRSNLEFTNLFMIIQTLFVKDEKGKTKLNVLYGNDYMMIKEVLIFIIDFFIENYDKGLNEQNENNNDFYKDMKLYELFVNYNNKDIKFLICCLFFVASINYQTYHFFKKENIIKITCTYIKEYILSLFQVGNDETVIKEKNRYLTLLIKILNLISKKENANKIYHIRYYEDYLDIVTILFYINHPCYREHILEVLFFFTLYVKCKIMFISNNRHISIIFSRLEELFKEINTVSNLANKLCNQKNDMIKKKDLISVEFKKGIEDNLELYDKLIEDAKELFRKYSKDFFLLIMILNNILMIDVNDDFFIKSISISTYNQFYDKNSGLMFKYQKFFENELNTILKEDLINIDKELIGKYYLIIPFNLYILYVKSNSMISFYFYESTTMFSVRDFSIFYLFGMLNYCLKDQNLLHQFIFIVSKILYSIRNDEKHQLIVFESLQPFFEKLISMLKDNAFPYTSFVYREIFRLFSTLITNLGSTELWLKFDSKKILADYSNCNRLNFIYKNPHLNWDLKPQSTNEEEDDFSAMNIKEKIIILPYKNITQYQDTMGVLFNGEYHIELSESIDLPEEFTITFKYFNPVIHSKRHTLLMNEDGTIPVIAISPNKEQLGYYTKGGEFKDSKIQIFTNDYFEKWISVALTKSYESVSSTKRIKKLSWYANGKFIYSRSIKETEEKNDIVSTIRYIGNSKDYKEPFGAFCDLRIYFRALSQNEIFEKISSIVTSNEIASTKSGEEIILQFFLSKGNINVLHNLTNQKFLNEEEILHAVKYINKIMIKIESRILFNNYDLIMLLSKYLSDEYSDEVREEVSKYIINIS